MQPYLTARADVADAADLFARLGEAAPAEAATRAARARDIGNHIHFCRWRQIERLLLLFVADEAVGTVH